MHKYGGFNISAFGVVNNKQQHGTNYDSLNLHVVSARAQFLVTTQGNVTMKSPLGTQAPLLKGLGSLALLQSQLDAAHQLRTSKGGATTDCPKGNNMFQQRHKSTSSSSCRLPQKHEQWPNPATSSLHNCVFSTE